MKKISVLIIVGSMNRGGAETMILNIIKSVNLKKFKFTFLYCTKKKKCDYDEEIEKLGIRIIRIPPPASVSMFKHINDLKNVFKNTGPYDVVHINTLLHAGIVSYVAKKCKVEKIIVHSHSTKDSKKTNLMRKSYEILSKFLINQYSTKKISCGQAAGIYLFGKKNVKNNKVLYLNNGINLNLYKSINENDKIRYKKNFNIDNKTIVIGTVGRLVDIKNQTYIINICKELKKQNLNFRMFIVGEGPYRKILEELIEKYNLKEHICLLGLRNDIPYLMNMFDIFLLPSLFEGFPLVLVEAQASGLVCLVSKFVSEEVKLNNDNVKFLPIDNDSIKLWVDEIIKFNCNKCNNKNFMIKKLSDYGFNAEDNTKILEKIYEGKL